MTGSSRKQVFIQGLLDKGETGIVLNGPNAWDPQVKDERMYDRVFAEGSLGLGEAYMDGWWECQDLAEFFNRLVRGKLYDYIKKSPLVAFQLALYRLSGRLFNRQSVARSKVVGEVHYDDRLFTTVTYDKRYTGSCAYWKDAKNIDEAQEAKLDLVAQKLKLEEGDRVFDIGSGWGAFLGYAAEKYKIKGVGVTISKDQIAISRERYGHLPLEFRFEDYRDYKGDAHSFDKLVSMGMFEHVGEKNYSQYFDVAQRLLKKDGLFLLHTIIATTRSRVIDRWLDKYIFPGGQLPTLAQITKAVEGKFLIEDVHNIGAHYDKTLLAWNENFQRKRSKIADAEGERAARMYEYYLLQCAGGFRARGINVVQLVLSPKGVPGGYTSIR